MLRVSKAVRIGGLVGLGVSAYIAFVQVGFLKSSTKLLPAGLPDPDGVHFVSHAFLLVCGLPWSFAFWLLASACTMFAGAEVPFCPAWLYWCMPPIAGMIWGSLARRIRARRTA
jgi:hypothetical protein